MKKCAIAIIGLVLAAFVFGSCESDSGGTIRVTNASNSMYVDIYVTREANPSNNTDTTPPSTGVIAEKKKIEPGATEDIKLPEGGPYYIKPIFIIFGLENDEDGNPIEVDRKPGTADKSMIYLFGGDTEEVKVTPK
ncbi:MAG: hypothetical protein LBC52_08110 [Treponema sp.]|jgi:hypothetical protein|nr:hypothetical protein [Treponema sp.]